MPNVIIDTNVLVSALIQRSYPYRIVYEQFLCNAFQLCVSEKLLAEYYQVLARPKFSRFPDFFLRAESLLAQVESRAVRYTPSLELSIITDVDDNMILELADECAADFIVTGNINDFTFSEYKQTKILTPKEFWEMLNQR